MHKTAKREEEKFKRKLASIEGQIAAIAERVGLLPQGLDPKALFDQLAKLQMHKGEAEIELAKARADALNQPEPATFQEFDREHWTQLLSGSAVLTPEK